MALSESEHKQLEAAKKRVEDMENELENLKDDAEFQNTVFLRRQLSEFYSIDQLKTVLDWHNANKEVQLTKEEIDKILNIDAEGNPL